MSNNAGPVKISGLPSASGNTGGIGANDYFVVVTGVASNNDTTTKATSSQVSQALMTLIISNPTLIPGPYANDSVANTANIALNTMYYDTTGIVRIRIT